MAILTTNCILFFALKSHGTRNTELVIHYNVSLKDKRDKTLTWILR